MTEKRKGEFLMVICAILWSISGLVMKYINWSPFLISGGRGVMSGLVIYIYMLSMGQKIKLTKKSLGIAFLTFVNIICFVAANKMTTAANAIVLQYTEPIFVLLVTALVLKKKLRNYEIVTVAIAFFGMILFFMDEMNFENIMGNVLAVTSGFFLGILYAFLGLIEDDSERISGLVLGHLSLGVIGIPIGLVMTEPSEITMIPILLVILLGTVQMGIPYVIFSKASTMVSGVEASLICMIEPILNPIWVAVFYGEIPGISALIGAAIIIGAVVSYTITDSKHSDTDG